MREPKGWQWIYDGGDELVGAGAAAEEAAGRARELRRTRENPAANIARK